MLFTITDIAIIKEFSKLSVYMNQPIKVNIDKAKIIIEKYLDNSLAIFSIFGFEFRDSSKRFIILFTVELA